MSIPDYSPPHNPLSQPDSPYTPGTPSGEAHRWYEFRKSEPLFEHSSTPGSSNLPVARIVTMLMLGFWGGVILSIVLSVI
jgi:hypothetical protein